MKVLLSIQINDNTSTATEIAVTHPNGVQTSLNVPQLHINLQLNNLKNS